MKRASIIALLLLGALTFWLILLPPETAARWQNGFLTWFAPAIRAAGDQPKAIAAASSKEERELRRLRDEVDRLWIERSFLERLREENDQLRRALAFVEQRHHDAIAARVIRRESAGLWSAAFIDKGAEHGLTRDLAVIAPAGVVGKLTDVMPRMSRLLFLTDERCQISARVEGASYEGITRGRRGMAVVHPEVELRFLPPRAGIPEGSLVVTAGLGGVYPEGLVIGITGRFERGETFGSAVVTPAADPALLRTVFVLKPVEPLPGGDVVRADEGREADDP
ncbi:MAG TPA: rod shape-determining protein MreC [Verrucomicrobiales bacterium]|nr:rod shape-determining protein MreC [Verrucomicrobiales bacterium]